MQLPEAAANGLIPQLRDNLGRVARQQPAQFQTRLGVADLLLGLYYLLALAAAGWPLAARQQVLLAL